MPQERTDGYECDKIQGLSFENVCFKYNRSDFGLDNISFSISSPSVIGIAGESGGERQRIAIANALLKKYDVILLDEFTSALDISIENKIMQHILMLKDKIIIIISHRIYTLLNCDEIIIINNGKIIEQGQPQNLLHYYCYIDRKVSS